MISSSSAGLHSKSTDSLMGFASDFAHDLGLCFCWSAVVCRSVTWKCAHLASAAQDSSGSCQVLYLCPLLPYLILTNTTCHAKIVGVFIADKYFRWLMVEGWSTCTSIASLQWFTETSRPLISSLTQASMPRYEVHHSVAYSDTHNSNNVNACIFRELSVLGLDWSLDSQLHWNQRLLELLS